MSASKPPAEVERTEPTHALAHKLRLVEDALAHEFSGIFSPETVGQVVRDTTQDFRDARVPTFIPTLVRRYAQQRLQAAAQVSGQLAKDVPEVLFVCVQNAGRSQMAAALLEHRGQGAAHARSSGSAPAKELHPGIAEVMGELGIPMDTAFPKPLKRELVEAADVVISMGCGDACPVIPGRRYEDWELPDPAGMSLADLREVRDVIDARVVKLLAELRRERADA